MDPVAYCGIIEVVQPNETGGNSNAVTTRQAGQQSNNYRCVERENFVDRQTGAYVRQSVKQNYSSGDVYKERSTGRVGYKDEMTRTSTYKYGDKSGFTEYQVEERFRVVNYGKSSSSSRGKSSSSNKYLK